MRKFIFFGVVLLLPKFGLADKANSVVEANLAKHTPQICNGYLDYGWFRTWPHNFLEECPAGYIFYGLQKPSGRRGRGGAYVSTRGDCCPLPAQDILTGPEVDAVAECPDDYVVVGAQFPGVGCEGCNNIFKCRKINTKRYRLGEKSPGVYWGLSGTYWKESPRMQKSDIPAGVRFGIGRTAAATWDITGCVGNPVGSLLVKKTSKRCRGQLFRELQYQGLPGDPPRGTPVRMFADCDDISDIYAESPQCTKLKVN